MKRIICLVLAVLCLLALCACGQEDAPAAKKVELQPLYDSFVPSLPDMMVMDESIRLNLLGVKTEDCSQVICAVAAVGLQADEVWLIEAADAEALENLKALAENRLNAKKEETSFYSPDQYAICEAGVIATEGLYLAFIVSPEAEAMEAAFMEAVK